MSKLNPRPRRNPVSITRQSIVCQIGKISDFVTSEIGRERLDLSDLRKICATLEDAFRAVEVEIERRGASSQWTHNPAGDAA
jgi:hypothetical protein